MEGRLRRPSFLMPDGALGCRCSFRTEVVMKRMLPGAWRRFVQEEVKRTRQDIAELVKRWYQLDDALMHVRRHSTQDGAVRDLMRENVGRQTHLEVELRKLRGLLLLTKICPRCRGRGQKFDRRTRLGRVMRPCSLCRAQGALWVHP